jgi:hypothetical protein
VVGNTTQTLRIAFQHTLDQGLVFWNEMRVVAEIRSECVKCEVRNEMKWEGVKCEVGVLHCGILVISDIRVISSF